MRNTKKTQAIADECAKAHCFICASYRGCKDEELIYVPLSSNSENIPQDPTFIIISKQFVQFVHGVEYYDVLDGLKLRDFRRGREIYKSLYRKFQEKDFECEDSVEAALIYLDNHPNCTLEEYEEWLSHRENAIKEIKERD